MNKLYNELSFEISKKITKTYSTSFSIAVSLLEKEIEYAIYAIYGFVRLADEIVDTFIIEEQAEMLDAFEANYYNSYYYGVSSNPAIHSFVLTVKKYNIPDDLIQAFLKSMRSDLTNKDYTTVDELNEYIYGSADVVGLMCLCVFVRGDMKLYEDLQLPARKLGSAFQKVNFLRDLNYDKISLSRNYFPNIVDNFFDDTIKKEIVNDIENDFEQSLVGIKRLPGRSKFAVLTAYLYNRELTKLIKDFPADFVIKERVSVDNFTKLIILVKSFIKYKFNLI